MSNLHFISPTFMQSLHLFTIYFIFDIMTATKVNFDLKPSINSQMDAFFCLRPL